jgi:threonine dehydrogenase-like Zn-dependent dehydrogenase
VALSGYKVAMRDAAIIEPTDALVRMIHPAGDEPEGGRILGHQGVGMVECVGVAVATVKPQDMVLVSCVSACGHCAFCRKFMYSCCTTGGWIRAEAATGAAADLVRVPHADTSLTLLPGAASLGHAAVLLAHRLRLRRITEAFDQSHRRTAPESLRQFSAQRQ